MHHLRKNASPAGAAGYSLRGSGDLYAWLDSFLYLRLHQGQTTLSAEHRSAPGWGPINLVLVQAHPEGAHLRVVPGGSAPPETLQNELPARILAVLSEAQGPLTAEMLRLRLQVRNQRVIEALRDLAARGEIQRSTRGFFIQSTAALPVQMSL